MKTTANLTARGMAGDGLFGGPLVRLLSKRRNKGKTFTTARLDAYKVLDFFSVISTLRTELSKDQFSRQLRRLSKVSGHFFWGVRCEGEVVGFCHASIGFNFSPNGKDLYLNDLIVAETHRYCGIGTRLLREVLSLARREKCQRLLITVRTENKSAINFYCRHGFKRRGWSRLMMEL